MFKMLIKFWFTLLPMIIYFGWKLIKTWFLIRKIQKQFGSERAKKEIKIINQNKTSLWNNQGFLIALIFSFLILIVSFLLLAVK